MYVRTLATVAVLAFASASCAAAEFVRGTPVTFEGKISALQAQRAFSVQVEGQTVIVYTTNAELERLTVGQNVRVNGRVSDDYIRVANIEVSARSIEAIGRGRTVTTAALQP